MRVTINGNQYNIKTVSDLKYVFETEKTESHFFDRKTLKFFGQTMRDFHLYKATKTINGQECFVLKGKGKDFRGNRYTSFYYFSVNTLEQVFP